MEAKEVFYVQPTYRFGDGVNNLPGKDFVHGFLRRHPDLTVRKANLIKRSRAALSHAEVNAFFDNFEKTAAGIPPENIYNCDETNLQDNPGAKRAIFSRGVKYAEKVSDHSKSSISVMFCGSATGVLLPPYVVYKSNNCYEGWTKGGPKGTIYSATPSGWFESFTFGDFIKKGFLAHVRRQPGRKLILCDNLSCHMSEEIFQLCREERIEFVCLPAHSTDKMQPLDVGMFRQVKECWRSQLTRYRDADPTCKLLVKAEFPAMLKELMSSLKPLTHLPKARVIKTLNLMVPRVRYGRYKYRSLLSKCFPSNLKNKIKKRQPMMQIVTFVLSGFRKVRLGPSQQGQGPGQDSLCAGSGGDCCCCGRCCSEKARGEEVWGWLQEEASPGG